MLSAYQVLFELFRTSRLLEPLPEDSKVKLAQLVTLSMEWIQEGKSIDDVTDQIAAALSV